MKRRLVLSALCALAALSAVAEKQPFDRYQTILDRQMFGPLPPGFDPTKPPTEVQKSSLSEKELTKEQEKLQSAIRFSVINVTSDGKTEVGFTDNSDPKTPRHYFLKVGETRDGWTVKEADAESATMTIAKGDVEVSLTLGGNSAQDANATSRAGVAATTTAAVPHRTPNSGRSIFGGGMLGRRKQREAARVAQEQAEKTAREAKEAEREAQEQEEKAQREKERAEQRQQLMSIQEELKRVREAKEQAEKAVQVQVVEENPGDGE